jgi:hypothetical protein
MNDRNKPTPKPLTTGEIRRKLSEGLRPGEDPLFYDVARFARARPAPPSEQALYVPPTPIVRSPADELQQDRHAPAGSLGEASVMFDTDIRNELKAVALPTADMRVREADTEPTGRGANEKRLQLLARGRTRDIGFSLALFAILSLAAWLVLAPRSGASRDTAGPKVQAADHPHASAPPPVAASQEAAPSPPLEPPRANAAEPPATAPELAASAPPREHETAKPGRKRGTSSSGVASTPGDPEFGALDFNLKKK